MSEQQKVSVFVGGTQKGGTTSLYTHFLEHPELQDPDRKEIHYFDDETVDWTAPDYHRLHAHFDGPAGTRLRYDITPIYQFWPDSLRRIARYNPAAKLIFLFRDPFERALSHWSMAFARKVEDLGFRNAIREGRNRLSGLPLNASARRTYSYLERGLYGEQIERALRLFPAEQLLFLRSEDLRDNHASTLEAIQSFLGIAPFPDNGPKREHVRHATPGTTHAGNDDLELVARFVAADMRKFQRLSGLDVAHWPSLNPRHFSVTPVPLPGGQTKISVLPVSPTEHRNNPKSSKAAICEPESQMVPSGPVAIGGVGGSGTRVVAALLQRLGRHIGSDLNEPLDNLWFTLLFKRPSVLLEADRDFAWLCEQFWARMEGAPLTDDASWRRITALAAQDRPQHDSSWLQARAQSWFDTPPHPRGSWGWKEPNTHLVIDRMLGLRHDLRYIHVLRNPLDMALSSNQNQLENWGRTLLDRPIEICPRDSLSYSCAVARRIERLSDIHGNRICKVDFDELCQAPAKVARQVAAFIKAPVDADLLDWFSALVESGRPAKSRHTEVDHNIFGGALREFVAALDLHG